MTPKTRRTATPSKKGVTKVERRDQILMAARDVFARVGYARSTGAPVQNTGGSTVLERVGAIEGELQRLTGKIEQLENRIDRVARDGANKIADLQFQVTELAGGDLSKLPPATPLGGAADGPGTVPGSPPVIQGGAMAIGEQADFDKAKAAFDAGDFTGSAGLFQTFTQTYTAGSLYSEAHFWRGEALSKSGDTSGAARAYLDSFSSAPNGAMAGPALLKLGQALGNLGQRQEACVTLTEVGTRFPGSPSAAEADGARRNLGCQ
jgi:tol-pal system protein YbgF